ncbi:MAG TPA: acyltransferase [Ramlibacter sp.]|uniref:acyltransferase family protein n=1 Tax=Ramlibacter sp. TaxID=1917967 RepID=UPI002C251A48|nr:acyltransferase [Ramlibacter sp.]HVZ46406.1 acyltransferase [Ramlibacter sp.]
MISSDSSAQTEDAAIEGLRGLAALVVVAVHFAPLVTPAGGPWGFAASGVDLFFVLSGFVFAPYFFGRRLAWAPHLVRRAFRLYPLYLTALAVYVLLKLPDPAATRHLAEHVFMLHTLRSPEVAFFYNGAFWSLPPEVEFYLALPLAAGLLRGRGFGMLFAAALGLHLALVALADGAQPASPASIATIHLPGLLVEFCLGAAAWQLAREGGARRLRMLAGLLVLAVMLWLYSTYIAEDPARAQFTAHWLAGNVGVGAACGYALVVSALAGRPNPSGWRLRLCLLGGQLSYGVYLFHNALLQMRVKYGWPIDGWVAVACCLLATLALAWVLHHAIEAPARDFGRNLSRRLAPARLA